jgi:predicted lipoprotein with Yx(FWY)xxD motif
MKFKTSIRSLIAAGFLLTMAVACKTDDEPDPVLPTFDITLKDTSLGKVLTDNKGMTLYFFARDVKGTSACSGTCLDTWPVFTMDNLRVDAGLTAADFASIPTADGKKQITYKGWPLYYYKTDLAPGDVKGENVGNQWFVAKPTYSLMLASTQLVGNDAKNYIIDAGVYKEGTGNTIYFTDQNGVAIYSFNKDKKNTNTYTKADFSNDATWPLYYTDIKDLPSSLDKTQFGTIKVNGSRDQLTYKGWPLYYYVNDAKTRGLNKGVSVPTPGVWPVIQKDIAAAPN